MLKEIAPLVEEEGINIEEANHFVSQVTDRFKNPYIEHQWLSIAVQYTSKMMMRTVPLLEKYYTRNHKAHELIYLWFVALFLFMC